MNATVGGSKLTLLPQRPRGQIITTFARFEAELADQAKHELHVSQSSRQPKPQPHAGKMPKRPSTARSAPRRDSSPAAVSAPRKTSSSTPGTPRASAPAYSSAKPMPRTQSVPAFAKAARPAAARLPRVASQAKAQMSSRAVATPRVRKNSLHYGSVVGVSPRLTRQRTGETPPPTLASPPPVRRSGLSEVMGAVSVASPPTIVAVAPRVLRPPPFSLVPDSPRSRGAPDQTPDRRPAGAALWLWVCLVLKVEFDVKCFEKVISVSCGQKPLHYLSGPQPGTPALPRARHQQPQIQPTRLARGGLVQ